MNLEEQNTDLTTSNQQRQTSYQSQPLPHMELNLMKAGGLKKVEALQETLMKPDGSENKRKKVVGVSRGLPKKPTGESVRTRIIDAKILMAMRREELQQAVEDEKRGTTKMLFSCLESIEQAVNLVLNLQLKEKPKGRDKGCFNKKGPK